MSAQDNLALVEAVIEDFRRGDIGEILGRLAEDVVWTAHLDPIVPWSGTYHGRAGVARFFRAVLESMDMMGVEVDDRYSGGDAVVLAGFFDGIVRGGKRSFKSRWIILFRLEQGLIKSYEQFEDSELANAFS